MREASLLAKVKDLDATALDPADVLAMATIDGARVLGWDDRIGSVEVGKRADLTVVRLNRPHHEPGGDVMTRLVHSACADDVEHVLVDGDVIVERGIVRTLDADQVLTSARREAKRVADRAGIPVA